MPSVTLKHPKESFESLMRRFKKSVEKSGILNDLREHEFYEKPSMKRKRERAAAVKRTQREHEESKLRKFVPASSEE